MQLGFVSAILPEVELEDLFRFAAAEKFDCIELMCWPPHPRGARAERRYAGVTHVDCSSLDDAGADGVRALAAGTGVGISGLGYYPNLLSPDPAEAAVCGEHLRAVIRAAARLGVRQVNTFIGRDWKKTVEDNWPRFLEAWRPLIALAEAQGVRIGIENCPMYFTRDEWPGGKNLATCPAIWRRMFAEIPSPNFGLNYDPSHLVWQQMDYLGPIEEFAGRIFHVHAKDAQLDRDRLNDVGVLATPLEYHQPRLPGQGDIDWAAFLAALARAGYRGPVAIEVEDRRFEGSLATRQQALRESAAHLRPLLEK